MLAGIRLFVYTSRDRGRNDFESNTLVSETAVSLVDFVFHLWAPCRAFFESSKSGLYSLLHNRFKILDKQIASDIVFYFLFVRKCRYRLFDLRRTQLSEYFFPCCSFHSTKTCRPCMSWPISCDHYTLCLLTLLPNFIVFSNHLEARHKELTGT